ncbi:hypothetical protein UFOVP737_7 [uncultured Caudovirales phage]|uniref:Phage tail tape measure protein n=1 Tax=uncultured Caudovirales phage TaxID=2100421 RepID=A0A6J7X0A7_9CAUD|nr:hypothetical protein UFOVP737_7 [uncultured Caudovirales phage]
MSNVAINIAAEFTGKKAFKQAETATQKLTGNVKKLAGAVGIAFGANAILAYSKASVKAFAQDEAAALRLNRAVENLGIGFANPEIADYIANLEKSAAIADDVLRPAFQGLLTTTGSLAQSQKLLNDAITISRASGIDLATVTEDLGKGYIGITRGLAKYNTGLTRAELNTKSFSEILGIVLNRSAGAAEDYLTTTSYKMEVLSIATGNASEIIGEGLIDALARLGGGTEASDAAKAIETLAKAFNFVTLSIGTAGGGLTSVLRNLKNLPKNIFEGFVGKQGGINFTAPQKPKATVSLSEKKQQEALAALEAAAIKRQKELNALKNKQLETQKRLAADKLKQAALDKAALVLAQGKKVFDEEGIQLAAAAQGKLTEEERVRIALKKDIYDLEAAINEENLSAAARLSNSIVDNARKLSSLRGDMIGLGSVPNPFTEWLSTLQQMATEFAKLANMPVANKILSDVPENAGGMNKPNYGPLDVPLNFGQFQLGERDTMRAYQQTSVTVNVAGSISTERDIVSAITQGLYAQQAAGTPVNYSSVY